MADRVGGAVAPPPARLPDGVPAGAPDGTPNMPDERYREIVASFKEHILAGDIFQGVPSRRLAFPAPAGGYPVYRRLRVANPAPYMFYLRMLGVGLARASPEPLARVGGREVAARPLPGNPPRG